MQAKTLFLPVIVQVFLTMAMYIRLAKAKKNALQAGEINESRRALYDDAWPESVIKVNNNIRNQFELPVLFYVLCMVLWALNATHVVIHALAWLFVASRFVHAMIHTGTNVVAIRRKVFTLGFFILVAMAVCAVVMVFM